MSQNGDFLNGSQLAAWHAAASSRNIEALHSFDCGQNKV